jgi:hypothetical protein
MECEGIITFSHGDCTEPRPPHSLADAQKDTEFIMLTGDFSFTAKLAMCKAIGVGGFDASLAITVGMRGEVFVPIHKPSGARGMIMAYAKAAASANLYAGWCSCTGGDTGRIDSDWSCGSVAGITVAMSVSVAFTDIKFGDGANGVDVQVKADASVKLSVLGAELLTASIAATPAPIRDVLDMDMLGIQPADIVKML